MKKEGKMAIVMLESLHIFFFGMSFGVPEL